MLISTLLLKQSYIWAMSTSSGPTPASPQSSSARMLV